VLRGDYDLGAAGSFGLVGSMFPLPKTEIKKWVKKKYILEMLCFRSNVQKKFV